MTHQTKVMTIDDSPTMRALLRRALTERGYEVVQAEDGLVALEWLEANDAQSIDAIITDINMPNLDGYGVIEKLRAQKRFQNHPILVLSTENSEQKKRHARQAGATGWIVKPFDPDKLAAALRRVIV